MKSPVAALPAPLLPRIVLSGSATRWAVIAACVFVLAGCAAQPGLEPGRPGAGRYFDPILGVWASPRLVDDGQPVPRGGGGYLVGRPYRIGGRTFVPNANPQGYVAVGTASWYGDAFHGRRTANGEIFDKGSISAAHPTLPLPCYVRVTNLTNGRSMIVRVNDRGPYHGGRVMDVSQRVAEALAFKNAGTGHVRIDYVGRASLAGSDDAKLLASLTTDGRPARLDGAAEPAEVADATLPPPPSGPSPLPNVPAHIAALPVFQRDRPFARPATLETSVETPGPLPAPASRSRLLAGPLTPERPLLRPIPHRTAPGRDPYFRPLFPAPRPKSQPSATISFAEPVRRPGGPMRSRPNDAGAATPADDPR